MVEAEMQGVLLYMESYIWDLHWVCAQTQADGARCEAPFLAEE